jgi:hypothetical protein
MDLAKLRALLQDSLRVVAVSGSAIAIAVAVRAAPAIVGSIVYVV